MYRRFFKRILDLIFSIFGLMVISPIFLLLLVIVGIHFRSWPFFFQKRLGKNARIFKIIKFKTMSDEKDGSGILLSDEERTTAFGEFLRKYSIDEIPQLINVLKGEMSLVGPRPLLSYYQDLYNDFQKRRNEIKPGITGWAQINGRNNVPWKQRFEMDVWYVENVSFLLDLKIFCKTAALLLLKTGSSVSPDEDISRDFEGN